MTKAWSQGSSGLRTWCPFRPIYSITGQGQVHVSDDVRFSLHYSADDQITHELGEPPPRPGPRKSCCPSIAMTRSFHLDNRNIDRRNDANTAEFT